MKKIYIKGYINYENQSYTFNYENEKLILISIENKYTFFSEYKFVDSFKGFTVDGFDIIFYINNNIYYKDGCYICSPRCCLLSMKKGNNLAERVFDAMRLSGGCINRFYSNHKMIEFNPCEEKNLKLKKIEETVSEEQVKLNSTNSTFELSIMNPGWKDDGIITFDNYDSLLRIKYNIPKNYELIIKDLNSVDYFFKFCTNRVNITFDRIFLENKNEDGKYEKNVEIFIPYMIDNDINKDMIDYGLLSGKLNDIFRFLDNSDYIFSIISNDNKSFSRVSNKDYCAAFSCFESIYHYVNIMNKQVDQIDEENILQEVKEELLPLLKVCDKKYEGKDRLKRDYIKRFIHIIENANLKLEKCIIKEVEKNCHLIDSLYYEMKDKINIYGIKKSVIKAVKDRDDIVHNNIVKLDEISIGIYELLIKINYIMILEYIGIDKEKILNKINYLALKNII